jgi:hypothetical protein
MKRILLLTLALLFSFSVFCADELKQIDEGWIKIKKRIRGSYSKMNLSELDKNNLDLIDKTPIAPDAEAALSDFLLDIIKENAVIDRDNSIRALNILETKFVNKKYFYDIASKYSFDNPTLNPYIIARIFKGLGNLLETNYDGNFKALKTVYESIKTPYVYKSYEGNLSYGTNDLVVEIIGYLRQYVKLLKSGKIKDNPDMSNYTAIMHSELDLKRGNFKNLAGAKELEAEY